MKKSNLVLLGLSITACSAAPDASNTVAGSSDRGAMRAFEELPTGASMENDTSGTQACGPTGKWACTYGEPERCTWEPCPIDGGAPDASDGGAPDASDGGAPDASDGGTPCDCADCSSIYGNGSAGARTFESSQFMADENLQYTDVTIPAGVTLNIESGSVIRCTGTFTNAGRIVVFPGSAGGLIAFSFNSGNFVLVGSTPPEAGISTQAAGNAQFAFPSTNPFAGAHGGQGLTAFEARQVLHPGTNAGGGGGSGTSGGGYGGGALTVLCKQGIVNAGSIEAVGNDGSTDQAGGGGGVILLGSKTSVTNTGTLDASGGSGADAQILSIAVAGSGGGGGGIVHLLAPTIVSTGIIDVSGGAGGAGTATNLAGQSRMAGAGGGASGGFGGFGAPAPADGAPIAPAGSGTPGYSFQTLTDPSDLF